MSAFFLKFEAIESRIASYSCPRGTSGRVHALRLRRCFQQNSRQRSLAVEAQLQRSIPDQGPHIHSIDHAEGKEGERFVQDQPAAGPLPQKVYTKTEHLSTLTELRRKHRHTYQFWDPYNLKRGTRSIKLQAAGDAPPLDLEDVDPDGPSRGGTAELYSALRARNPNGVLGAILNQVKEVGIFEYANTFLSTIPASTFSEILRCIDPKHFINRYADLYKEISPSYATVLGLPPTDQDGHYKFCKLFLDEVRDILLARQNTRPLTLLDYKFLLKCARVTGDIKASRSIWHSMHIPAFDQEIGTRREPVAPDVECFNHYLATRCWSDSLNPIQRYRQRITPTNYGPRGWDVVPYTLKQRIGPRGLKARVSKLFREMVERGIPGNEETFCLLMVALARENDIPGLESILKRVWEIDIENLLGMDESELPSPKSYPLDSPFHPSQYLLFTLAYSYGINNSIPSALRIIDYVSRQYSIPITLDIWKELLQWTYVLSIKRYGERLNDGTDMGQLPQAAVGNLWDTMTSEPYNIKPDMAMYNRLIPNLLQRQRYGDAQIRMEEARKRHKRDVLNLSKLILAFNTSRPHTPKAVLEQRARDLTFAHLRVRVNRQYIRRWVRLLVRQGSVNLIHDELWATQNVPRIVDSWSLFLPRMLKYQIGNGEIRLGSESRAQNLRRQRRHAARNMASIDRVMLPDDDQETRREKKMCEGACTNGTNSLWITSQFDADALTSCRNITADVIIQSNELVTISLNSIQRIDGFLEARNSNSLEKISAPDLEWVNSKFFLRNLPSLSNVSFPRLETIEDGVYWENLPNLFHPVLISQGVGNPNTPGTNINGDLYVKSCGLDILNTFNFGTFPRTGNITIKDNPQLVSVNFTRLISASQLEIMNNNPEAKITLPELFSVSTLNIKGVSGLDISELSTMDGNLILKRNSFTTLTAPELTAVGGDFILDDNQQLSSLSIPNLETIGGSYVEGNFKVIDNPSLLTVSLPKLAYIDGITTFVGNFTSIDLRGLREISDGFYVNTTTVAQFNCTSFDRLYSISPLRSTPSLYNCISLPPNPSSPQKDTAIHYTSPNSNSPTLTRSVMAIVIIISVIVGVGLLGLLLRWWSKKRRTAVRERERDVALTYFRGGLARTALVDARWSISQ